MRADVRLESEGVVMHVVLCYTELPVIVSSAFMFFPKQFNMDNQRTLVELNG